MRQRRQARVPSLAWSAGQAARTATPGTTTIAATTTTAVSLPREAPQEQIARVPGRHQQHGSDVAQVDPVGAREDRGGRGHGEEANHLDASPLDAPAAAEATTSRTRAAGTTR